MRRVIVAVAFLCLAVPAFAQSPKTLLWDQPQVATAADAQALTFKYYADAATTGVTLTGVTCTGTTTVTCSAPFPAFTPGAHTLTVTASSPAGEGVKSAALSFTFVLVPAAPVNVRVQ